MPQNNTIIANTNPLPPLNLGSQTVFAGLAFRLSGHARTLLGLGLDGGLDIPVFFSVSFVVVFLEKASRCHLENFTIKRHRSRNTVLLKESLDGKP